MGDLPFLRWAGSKRQLLPVLNRYWDAENHRRYVEPFAGSACLFFCVAPPQAILGDINAELMSTYRQVKFRVNSVISSLECLRKGRGQYYSLRAADLLRMGAADRAARFIYLNRYCFNGLYRTNRAGRFNVPYGGEKSGGLPAASHLRTVSRLLRSAELVCGDFETVLERTSCGDFVYMDPPFSVKARRVFNEYDRCVFSSEGVKRLRRWMERLADQRVSFLVSYAACEEADFLRKGFKATQVKVKRNISGFCGSRCHSNEILISYSSRR